MSMPFVPGTGPVPCRWMLVVDGPNKEDSSKRRFLSGKGGAEIDRFFDNFHAPSRERWYVTGLMKAMPEGKEWTSEETQEALPYFERELERVQPELIVTMGRRATAYFCGDRYGVDELHGIPQRSDRTSALVVPMYAPMHALLSPEMYARFVKDMGDLERLLKGTLPEPPFDDGVGDYRILAGAEVAEFLGDWTGDISMDTEGSVAWPWSIQITLWPGHGFLVMSGDFIGLAALGAHLRKHRNRIVWHFALHDIPVARAMGIETADLPFTDTMQMAYVLGEQQGLKSLGLRLAGMEQEEWSELVAEPAEEVAREWLADIAWGGRFERDYGPKPCDLEKALRLVERMLLKDAKTPVRERWENCRAKEILEEELMLVGEMPEPTMDMVKPRERAVRYAGRDTDLTCRVLTPLEERIDAMGLRTALNLDLGIIPMVERMRHVGMGVDVEYLHDLSSVLGAEHAMTVEMIATFAGREVNPSSGEQVAEWLFNDLRIPWKKKTKSGDRPATDKKILEALSKDYSLAPEQRRAVDLTLEAREIVKAKTTFCDNLPNYVGRDGRLHPYLLLTRTGTGRTASKDPNVLALPKWSARGKLIRGGFVAGPGRQMSEWDLSQIELRVLAIESEDALMLEQFRSGHDFHTMGAAKRYGLSPEAVSKKQRFSQKAINFGIVMGITEFGLMDQFHKGGHLDVTEDDCREQLTGWRGMYSSADAYLSGKHAEARRNGYVRSASGRIRYLEGVHSPDKYMKAESLRQAQATPIQTGARDLMKEWMGLVWRRLPEVWAMGLWAEVILDVHDAMLVEHDEAAFEPLDRIMHETLASMQRWPIPVICEGNTGSNWGEV